MTSLQTFLAACIAPATAPAEDLPELGALPPPAAAPSTTASASPGTTVHLGPWAYRVYVQGPTSL